MLQCYFTANGSAPPALEEKKSHLSVTLPLDFSEQQTPVLLLHRFLYPVDPLAYKTSDASLIKDFDSYIVLAILIISPHTLWSMY